MRKLMIWSITLTLMAAMLSCGKSQEEQRAEAARKEAEQLADSIKKAAENMGEPQNLSEAMSQIGQLMSGGDKVEPIDFRELQKFLPEKLAGMERSDLSGEKAGAFGMKVSHAEAVYSTSDGGSCTIKITDMGTMKGMAAMAAGYAWTAADFDRETQDSYERTMTYKGFKGFEQYNHRYKNGEIAVIIGNRFIVNIDGSDVSMEQMKSALDRIDVDKLEAKKKEGVQSE